MIYAMFAEWFSLQIDGAFVAAMGAMVVALVGVLRKHRKKENATVNAVQAAEGNIDARLLEMTEELASNRLVFSQEMARQRNDLLAHLGRNRQQLQAGLDDLVVRFDSLEAKFEGLPKSGNSIREHPSGEHAVVKRRGVHGNRSGL